MFRDSEKTYYPKISQRRKGAEKGPTSGFPPLFFAPLRLCERYKMGECVFSESLIILSPFPQPIYVCSNDGIRKKGKNIDKIQKNAYS